MVTAGRRSGSERDILIRHSDEMESPSRAAGDHPAPKVHSETAGFRATPASARNWPYRPGAAHPAA